MLQAMIYYIATVILTKELVMATDQCIEYQFKTPGVSCEDIYNKSPKTHQCSGYYWIVKRVFCGMTYTGSSCEYIYKKYPEIYKNNPEEKSGYYHLNNKQWTYCNMTEIAGNDFTSTCAALEVIKSTYQSFLPGESCESIYNNDAESHEWSGHYWITNRVTYCGMAITGSSCEEIYNNNLDTRDKPGYYHINDTYWTFCNMTEINITATKGDFISVCAGEEGTWRRIVNIDISAGDDCPSGWRKGKHSNVSFCRVVASYSRHTCSSASFSTNGTSYQKVCGRARGYQKGYPAAFHGTPLGRTIDHDYVSGLSITYGSNPRRHIWTYASGRGERFRSQWNCPCSVHGGYRPASFVGNDYYCESGSIYDSNENAYFFNDTLWDGKGCVDSCCDNRTQPWFYFPLTQPTKDDIEARICTAGDFNFGTTLIDQLELYIQ